MSKLGSMGYQAVEKVLIRQGVQKFQVQGAKKVQGRSVVSLRESLNFLKQRRNWKIFNALLCNPSHLGATGGGTEYLFVVSACA
ncbi:MAG: hypothetical protein V5B78_12150 [Desulfohalobiaceae bacterium]